ncbi:MAG: hypothetical protein ACLQMV_09220 [Rhodoblastus sp.]|uniref:hypothetical protein n=1 Tax=Rhodoblastus sp. TaxID=1962975 RepID=UPI003FD88EFF
MSVSQAFPPLGVEFEPFLYAIVCDDGNGTPLTIISAIARTGADPWTEAARIAKLPKTAALDVLARMVPERGAADGVAIANRLFALLPVARANRNIPFVGAKANAPKANAPKSNAPKSNALKSNAPGWSPLVSGQSHDCRVEAMPRWVRWPPDPARGDVARSPSGFNRG